MWLRPTEAGKNLEAKIQQHGTNEKRELLHAEHRLAGEKNLATGQFKKRHSSAPDVNLSVIPAA